MIVIFCLAAEGFTTFFHGDIAVGAADGDSDEDVRTKAHPSVAADGPCPAWTRVPAIRAEFRLWVIVLIETATCTSDIRVGG